MSLQKAYQMNIFAGAFQAKLNPNHELLILAERIDWERIAEELLPCNKIGTLVIVGISADHCVSTTTRMAGNLGF